VYAFERYYQFLFMNKAKSIRITQTLICLNFLFLALFPAISLAAQSSTKQFNKKVFVLVFDPQLTNGKTLTVDKGWNDPQNLANQYTSWIQSVSNGRVNYTITANQTVTDANAFMPKMDGFRYTEESLQSCLSDSSKCHPADGVDYTWIVNTYGICDKVNAGTVDEVWMFAYPYGGFNESRLIGPNGYLYNSGPLVGTSCNRLIPVMGYNYERGLSEMVEDLGHRTEASLTKAFGSWEENRTAHAWDKFALVSAQSPSYNYSGCGSVHYAPNSAKDYDWGNTNPTETTCDDFANYPDLSINPTKRTVTCSEWGCNGLGYFTWWFGHMPKNEGGSTDGKANDWWEYITDPNAVYLRFGSQSPTQVPTNYPTATNTPVSSSTVTVTPVTTALVGAPPTLPDNSKPYANFYAAGFNAQWIAQYTAADLEGASSDGDEYFDVAPCTAINFWAEMRNIGDKPWLASGSEGATAQNEFTFATYKDLRVKSAPVWLGYDICPGDSCGKSYFKDTSWVSDYRIGTLTNRAVAPGSNGRVNMRFQVPCNAEKGRYREDISAASGYFWVNNNVNGDPLKVMHIWVGFDIK